MEMPLPPASRTDRAAVEATAVSETLGAELLVFPGTRERRHVGAVQRRTETIKPGRCAGVRPNKATQHINTFYQVAENETPNLWVGLLATQPMKWDPLKCILLLKFYLMLVQNPV